MASPRAKNLEHGCAEDLSGHLAKLFTSRELADVVVTQDGCPSHQIDLHRCVLRARLPDGEVLDTLVGKDENSQDPSEKQTIVLSQDVSWEAVEAWLYGLYSGTLLIGEELKESLLSKKARNRIGGAIIYREAVKCEEDITTSATGLAPVSKDDGHSNKHVPGELFELQRDMDSLLSMPPEQSYADIAITFETFSGLKRVVYAHKAILAARSHYFGAMVKLSDKYPEGEDTKEGDTDEGPISKMSTLIVNADRVPLGVAADVIRFLYTGIIAVRPDRVAHLLLLSDQWCMDDLRSTVLLHLRNRVCRKFRKPEGAGAKDVAMRVMQVMQLCRAALHFGLPDIDSAISELRKDSVMWLSEWGTKCWSLKEFAYLPQAIHHEIRDVFLTNVTHENCVDRLIGCDQILATLPAVAWANPVKTLTGGLRSKLGDFILEEFSAVSKDNNFQKLMSGGWNAERADELTAVLMEKMSPSAVVHVIVALNNLGLDANSDVKSSNPLKRLDKQARSYALRHLMWIVRSDLFNDMEPDIRERFIASVETAGIKMRGDDESKEGSSRGGEFFVLVDGAKDSNQLRRRCPLKGRVPLSRRRSWCDQAPLKGLSTNQVFGSKSVDLTMEPRRKGRHHRSSSRASSTCSEESSEWNNSFSYGPIHSTDGSWSSASGSGVPTQEVRSLRRKTTKHIPKPPKVDQFLGTCFLGSSRIPKPPRGE